MEKLFDVNGYNYDLADEHVTQLRHCLFAAGKKEVVRKICDVLEFGGKAIGLVLAESIAPEGVVVPRWFGVPTRFHVPGKPGMVTEVPLPWLEEQMESQKYDLGDTTYYKAQIVRSSDPEEDWIDPRSGIKQSAEFRSGNISDIQAMLNRRIFSEERVIVQQLQMGMGCVIDIGYSELLGRPIVRVAYGNFDDRGTPTSATWDNEAHYVVYDAETFEQVGLGKDYWRQDASGFLRDISKDIVRSLKDFGITFGVQMELIVPASRYGGRSSKENYLVQIRPSPEKIRGMKSKPSISGKLLTTVASVNRAGDVSGEAIRMHHGQYGSHDSLSVGEKALRGYRPLDGKIVVWDKESNDPSGCTELVWNTGRLGAVGQVSCRPLFQNSKHGTFLPYSRFERLQRNWLRAAIQGVQFGWTDRYVTESLKSRLSKGENITLRLISDGLIGQVYELE